MRKAPYSYLRETLRGTCLLYTALTAAQITDALEHILPGEEESRQYIADLGIVQVGIIVRDLFEQCLLAVEHMMLLIVITNLYIGT